MNRTHEYFDGLAETYDRFRPGYPAAALDMLLRGLSPSSIVVDVGCGTGISSRALTDRGVHVIGIDPSRAMLEHARLGGDSIEYRQGTAERTGLADGSVDSVVCFQSFHWFDRETALSEFARVLRPDGRLAAIWNRRSLDHPATAAYSQIVTRAQSAARVGGKVVPTRRSLDTVEHAAFADLQRHRLVHYTPVTHEMLLGRARSASYYPDGGELREELDAALTDVFDRFQSEGTMDVEYIVEIAISRRR